MRFCRYAIENNTNELFALKIDINHISLYTKELFLLYTIENTNP